MLVGRCLLQLQLLIIVLTVHRPCHKASLHSPNCGSESARQIVESLTYGSQSTSKRKRETGNDTSEPSIVVNQWVSHDNTDPNVPGRRNFPSFSFDIKAAAFRSRAREGNYQSLDWLSEIEDLAQILLFGGYAGPKTAVRGTWLYNLLSNAWSSVSSKSRPADRIGHTLVSLCANMVVLFGGVDETRTLLNDTWIFDGETRTWAAPSTSVSIGSVAPRTFHSGVSLEYPSSSSSCQCNQSLIIYGGLTSWEKTHYRRQMQTSNDVWELRCVGEMNYTWINHRIPESFNFPWPRGRYFHMAVPITKTKMSLWGGITPFRDTDAYPEHSTVTCWSYDVASDLWSLCNICFKSLHDRNVAVYSMNYERIMYFGNTMSVFTLQRGTEQWQKMKILPTFSAVHNRGLHGIGIAIVEDKVLVFRDDTPSSYFKSSGLAVLTLEQFNWLWVWSKKPDPLRNPPTADLEMKSWFVSENEIMLLPLAPYHYHIMPLYMLESLPAINDFTFPMTFSEVKDDDDNAKQLFLFAERSLLYSVTVWKMDLDTGVWWETEMKRRVLFSVSTSAIWNGKGLLLYGRREVKTLSEVVAYIASIQDVVWIETVSPSRPHIRDDATMVQISNTSFVLFGGQFNTSASSIFNDLWILHLDEKVDYYNGTVVTMEARLDVPGTPSWSHANVMAKESTSPIPSLCRP